MGKFEGLMSRMNATKALVRNLNCLASQASAADASADVIKVFIAKCKQLNKWQEDHWRLVEQILELEKKPDTFSEQEFHQELIDFDDVIANIRMVYDDTNQNRELTTATSSGNKPDSIPVRLPSISLPLFSGNIVEWTSFISLFNSLVIDNRNLTDVERLQYLRSSLRDEASDLVKSLELSDENFTVALRLLHERYNNPRKIATAHADKILNLPICQTPSAKHIRILVAGYREHIEALRVLKVIPVEFEGTADGLFLFLTLIRKLDPVTRSNFERSLEDNKRVPTPDRLIEFLEKECSALEASTDVTKSRESRGQDGRRQPIRDGGRYYNQGGGVYSNSTRRGEQFNAHTVNVQPEQCIGCNSATRHSLYNCSGYLKLSPVERKRLVQINKLCFNCLRPHIAAMCQSDVRCKICKGKHHTTLHTGNLNTVKRDSPLPSSTETEKGTSDTTTCASSCAGGTNVILSTVILKIQGSDGRHCLARALLDTGSQSSYITTHLAQKLKVKIGKANMFVTGLAGQRVEISGEVTLKICGTNSNTHSMTIPALVVNKITGNLPPAYLPFGIRDQLKGLQLADADFDRPGPVDCLLGADVFVRILTGNRVELQKGGPMALETLFGWVIMGSHSNGRTQPTQSVVACHALTNTKLEESLQRFWSLEEPITKMAMAEDELVVEQHFLQTHSRLEDGRYMVRLPFKEDTKELESTRDIAEFRFKSLERRFQRDPEYHRMYQEFMQEYLKSGHMQMLSPQDVLSLQSDCFYLPHHGVWKPSSTTTKLRVVFDASAHSTSNSGSLNSILYCGPKLQQDIIQILLRFRTYAVAFTTDIKQMFRGVWLHPEDRRYQLILWRNSSEQPLQVFQLNTVTFGMSCSPFLAMRTITQLVNDHGTDYPKASKIIPRDMFVDDIVSGAQTVEDGIALQQQLIELFSRGGFQLRKWTSNVPDMLKLMPENYRESPRSFHAADDPLFEVLGMSWLPSSDRFIFTVKRESYPATKRGVLSCIARFYDPLGFISPVSIWARIFMQALWVLGIDWDAVLPADLAIKWQRFLDELQNLSRVTVPRYLRETKGELHGFSDASECGYAAVIYFLPSSGYPAHILLGKSRVAPTRQVSLPRLELCGAHMLAKLLNFAQKALEDQVEITAITAWTDSTVVLSWIRSIPRSLKTFVANRVSEIQQWTSPDGWRHVPSSDNPADCASRGVYPNELPQLLNWFEGPSFLSKPLEEWPSNPIVPIPVHELPECKPNPIHVLVTTDMERVLLDWEKYSTWMKCVRIMAYVLRFVNNCTRRCQRVGPLSLSELKIATMAILKSIQREAFGKDLIAIEQGSPCTTRLQRLGPFIDQAGLLRVGGRLSNSDLAFTEKHPIILPTKHQVTLLIIDHYHVTLLHAGPRTLQSMLNREYWILSARSIIRQRLFRCVTCFKHRPTTRAPLMADLPTFRVRQARPFQHVSVDFAGPFLGKPHRRSKGRCKMYLCLFVCCVTKAVHLEVVSDMSTQTFIAALRRFISRRGISAHIYSDQGSNFVGASLELQKLYKTLSASLDKQTIADFASAQGITWHFQPPAAPHFGGLHEAAIKQAKFHIKRAMGSQILTYEELTTLFAQVEAILNSRPLCSTSNDPTDTDVLTPGHFLIGTALRALPSKESNLQSSLSCRWKLIQGLQESFWKRWHREYLHTLIQRGKWYRATDNLKRNSVAIIQDDNLPPQDWKLARIVELKPGPDGIVRVVKLRTASGDLFRPAVKVFPLPSA